MIKNAIAKIHLWLGLTSGVIVLIVSLTGCIYAFSKEITEWKRQDSLYVENQADSIIAVSKLWEKAEKEFGPEKKISWVNIYNDPQKTWVFSTYKSNSEGLTYFSTIEYYQSLFIDPYSGEVKAIYDEKLDFFNVVKFLHWSLLLKTEIGQPIVGWSTLIFVILLISGLVLWWPKSFKTAKNRFNIKWKKPTKLYRKLYDLHNVLGFYSIVFALLISLTGMVWAFRWFQTTVYVVAAGTTSPPDVSIEKSSPENYTVASPIDEAYSQTRKKYADANAFRISLPADSLGVINVYVQQKEGLYYISHQLQFDQYSGKLLKERKHSDKNFGEKLITANYDIHVGAILGIPGKILAFLVSLICASLPVTGFFMWWKRRRNRQQISLF